MSQAAESQLTSSVRLHQRFAAEALRAHAVMSRKLEGRRSAASAATAAAAAQGSSDLELPAEHCQNRSVRPHWCRLIAAFGII